MLRKTLIKESKLSDGGSTTSILNELEDSGFIKKYVPFGKRKRDAFYRLSDPYTLFYLTFVKDSKAQGEGAWLARLNNPKWQAWSGYAFEYLCMYHIDAIKKHLGISSVYTEVSPWKSNLSKGGAQIDLLLDRNDRIINICEMKFSTSEYAISAAYAKQLTNKLTVFKSETETKKTLLLTFITSMRLKNNQYAQRMVKDALTMDALFD